MKILIAAHACHPYFGSEPGVGWSAVCRIAQRHDVSVIVDVRNKAGWEKAAQEGIIPSNVKARFLRKYSEYHSNRIIARLQSWMNYVSFNRQVLAAALSWHAEEQFDLCHQVTIAAWRIPSPLWRLPIPFVWGPIGGAGFIPPEFRPMLGFWARIFEKIRDIQTWFALRSRGFQNCIEKASVVIAANEETEKFLLPSRKGKSLLRLPVTCFPDDKIIKFRREPSSQVVTRPIRLFAGGNMVGSKGLGLALHALALVKKKGIDFRYVIAGGGSDIVNAKRLAARLGLEELVEFHPGFRGDEYLKALHEADVYFLPSFRETMGMTLVEAIFAGCYPVVADVSAQGEIVRLAGGIAVPVSDFQSLAQGLADGILWCSENRGCLSGWNPEGIRRIQQYFSEKRYDEVLDHSYAVARGGPRAGAPARL